MCNWWPGVVLMTIVFLICCTVFATVLIRAAFLKK